MSTAAEQIYNLVTINTFGLSKKTVLEEIETMILAAKTQGHIAAYNRFKHLLGPCPNHKDCSRGFPKKTNQ
jgi:hypothetical protein